MTPNPTPAPFPTLVELQEAHDALLLARDQLDDASTPAPAFWADVAVFVARAQASGALFDLTRDRRSAQSILDYWANALYRANQPTPAARLADFDPALAPALPDEPAPYQGLAAFGQERGEFFFGRERLVQRMLARLAQGERLLVVVGASGSGKSSLVLAGLLPALQAGALPDHAAWRLLTLTPGAQPLTNLAQAVCGASDEGAALITADELRGEAMRLAQHLAQPGAAPALVIVDQFEELFTLGADGTVQQAFVAQLLALTTYDQPRHVVVLTMRSDFFDSLARFPALYARREQARVDVDTLAINELRAAIEEPAAKVGLRFQEGIVDDLIATILGERAGLPLLQFTLLKLWQARRRNRITHEVYGAVGNPRQALERSAEAFFSRLPFEEQQVVREQLLRLVRPGEGSEFTSRRLRLLDAFVGAAASDRVTRVLRRLIFDERLLKLSGADPALMAAILAGETNLAAQLAQHPDAQIEVAHEALVRNWRRLVDWLDEERERLRQRFRLGEAAAALQQQGRTPDLLWRGAQLAAAVDCPDLTEIEQAFVQAGRAAEAAAARAEREAETRKIDLAYAQQMAATEQRNSLRLRRLLIGMAVLLLFSLIVTGFAIYQTRLAMGANLAIQARTFVRDQNLRLATLLALEARQLNPRQGDRVLEGEIPNHVPFRRWKPLFGHYADVNSVAWRPDGKQLASGASDNTIIVWDTENGTVMYTLQGHGAAVRSLTWRLDGKQLASGASDKTVIVWNAENGEIQRVFQGHSADVNSVVWRPDGKQLASGSSDNTVIVWDMESGAAMHTLQGHSNSVNSVAWRPDGKQLASGSSDNTVIVWDMESGAAMHTLQGHSNSVNSVAWRPDGKQLASGSSDNTVIVWDVETWTVVHIVQGHNATAYSVAWSLDGKQLASGSSDNTVIVWDVESEAVLHTLQGHNDAIQSVAWRPDDKQSASASWDNTVIVWDMESGGSVRPLQGHGDAVYSVAWRPDSKQLASGSSDNRSIVWDAKSGAVIQALPGYRTAVYSVAWRPDSKQLASGLSDNSIIVWNVESKEVVHTLQGHSKGVWSVAWSLDGKRLASGSWDNTVIIWDVEKGTEIHTLREHRDSVWSVAWSQDGKQLASGSWDNTVIIWDVEKGTEKRTLQGHRSAVYSVAWRPKSKQLASGSSDNTIIVWDAETGKVLHTLQGHQDDIWSVAWSQDGKLLASGANDNTVIMWDVESETALHTLQDHRAAVRSVAWSPDGKQLASGSNDNTIILYPWYYLQQPCEWAQSNLTVNEWIDYRGWALYRPTCPKYPSQPLPEIGAALARKPMYLLLSLPGRLFLIGVVVIFVATVRISQKYHKQEPNYDVVRRD